MHTVGADEIRQTKKAAFLEAVAELPSIRAAAGIAGIARCTHYEWMKDPDYATAFEEALERGKQSLHDVAVERAHNASDTMLIFLLKGMYPDKYRERSTVNVNGELIVKRLVGVPEDEV